MRDLRDSFKWAALIPELTCSDLENSRNFYVKILAFEESYSRDGFAFLSVGAAQLMLEQGPSDWLAAPLDRPFGRGVNLQIEVDAVAPILASLKIAATPLFMEPREKWYRAGNIEHGQREFIVQDPDGYLLRFCETLGERAVPS